MFDLVSWVAEVADKVLGPGDAAVDCVVCDPDSWPVLVRQADVHPELGDPLAVMQVEFEQVGAGFVFESVRFAALDPEDRGWRVLVDVDKHPVDRAGLVDFELLSHRVSPGWWFLSAFL